MDVTIDEGQRQMVLLALAKLSIERPGWDWALGETARAFNGVTMYQEFKDIHTPVEFKVPEATTVLTEQEFQALDEYSTTMPTGTRIGKQWRAQVEHDGAVLWLMGEYAEGRDKQHVAVKWSRIVLSDLRQMVKMTRKVSRTLFCSCGAACTGAEYEDHVRRGHDQGETVVRA